MAPRAEHGLGKKPSERLSGVRTFRVSPAIDLRLRELADELGVSDASVVRMLLERSLGDEANLIAIREAAFLLREVRADLAREFYLESAAVAERAAQKVLGESVDVDDEDVRAERELEARSRRHVERDDELDDEVDR